MEDWSQQIVENKFREASGQEAFFSHEFTRIFTNQASFYEPQIRTDFAGDKNNRGLSGSVCDWFQFVRIRVNSWLFRQWNLRQVFSKYTQHISAHNFFDVLFAQAFAQQRVRDLD